MKILIISDVESQYLWNHLDYEKFKEVELILSAGDLNPKYLSYLVTMLNVPLLYIHGNHDAKYAEYPPLGCQCIEDKIVEFKGVRILGLGGSRRYKKGPHQYNDKEMGKRVRKLRWNLLRRGGFDILLTHASFDDDGIEKDFVHKGFPAFNRLMDRYSPKYMIHGHDHLNYSTKNKRIKKYKHTTVINGYDYFVLEF